MMSATFLIGLFGRLCCLLGPLSCLGSLFAGFVGIGGFLCSGLGGFGRQGWARLFARGQLEAVDGILPQAALVEIGGFHPPRLARRHLRGG